MKVSGSSAFIRHSMACPRDSTEPTTESSFSPAAMPDLRFHQVHAGDHFGDGMFDLNAGIHLDEVKFPEISRKNSTVPALKYTTF